MSMSIDQPPKSKVKMTMVATRIKAIKSEIQRWRLHFFIFSEKALPATASVDGSAASRPRSGVLSSAGPDWGSRVLPCAATGSSSAVEAMMGNADTMKATQSRKV